MMPSESTDSRMFISSYFHVFGEIFVNDFGLIVLLSLRSTSPIYLWCVFNADSGPARAANVLAPVLLWSSVIIQFECLFAFISNQY